MNPYELIEEHPNAKNLEKGNLNAQVRQVIKCLTDIHLRYENIENTFFTEKNTDFGNDVEKLYKDYAKGLISLFHCLSKANIKELNLNDYLNNILVNNKLHDSDYFTKPEGTDKIKRLMDHFDRMEGRNNIPGYQISALPYQQFKVSTAIAENFMVIGFKVVSFLTKAIDIIYDTKLDDKSKGQAFLIEALLLWIKIGNTLRVDEKEALKLIL